MSHRTSAFYRRSVILGKVRQLDKASQALVYEVTGR